MTELKTNIINNNSIKSRYVEFYTIYLLAQRKHYKPIEISVTVENTRQLIKTSLMEHDPLFVRPSSRIRDFRNVSM